MKSISAGLILFVSLLIFSQACKKDKEDVVVPDPDPVPAGHPKLPSTPYDYAGVLNSMPAYYKNILTANPTFDNTPADNPVTNDGATLGRVLFYDKALSFNNTTSCGSCHHQDKAFVDGLALSKGFDGGTTRRNSMAIANLRFFQRGKMFWDERAATLEIQVLKPITDNIEMGMPSLTALETKLAGKTYYGPLFQKAFGSSAITSDRIAKALAQFIRSIVSFNSKYDQGLTNNFANLTAQELNGMQRVNATCGECHTDHTTSGTTNPPTFLFNTVINPVTNGLDLVYSDNGAGEVTGDPMRNGTFKVVTLRNIALTGPYMHDGRFTTLEQVLTHYQSGVKNHPNLGFLPPAGGFGFSDAVKADMIAYLKTLSDQTLLTDPKYSDPFK